MGILNVPIHEESIVPTSLQTLGIDKLTVDEQLELVQALWDHIAASNPGPRLSDSQRQELRRRVAEDEAHPDDHVSWEQVKAEARKRAGR
jgi:putative addiction module component (TIGR02574 family)